MILNFFQPLLLELAPMALVVTATLMLQGDMADKRTPPWTTMPNPHMVILTLQPLMLQILLLCSKDQFLEYQEKTTQSMLKFLRPDSHVKVKLMEVTMLMVRLRVKSSTSAQLMELEVLLSTASSVPTAQFSTRTISSATGGSTLIVLKPRVFSPSMTRLLPNELKLTELLLMPLLLTLLQLNQLLTMQLLLNMVKLALPDRDRSLAGMVEEAKSRFPLLLFLDVLYF